MKITEDQGWDVLAFGGEERRRNRRQPEITASERRVKPPKCPKAI